MSSIEIVKANSSTLIYSRCFRGPPLSDFETNWIKTESSAHLESYITKYRRMKPETKYRRSSYLTIIQKNSHLPDTLHEKIRLECIQCPIYPP